jgi:flagellar biosynthesis protein FlhF
MNVKTFRSSTIKDALSQVREQLGPDAVILETRQNNDGRRPVVEILAGDDAALGGEAKPLFAPTATAYGAAAYAKSQTQAGPIASEPSAKTTGSIPMTPNDFGVNDELRALRREIRRVAEVHRADEDPVDRALATFGRQFERGLSESTDLLRALLAETRAQSGMGMDPAQARVYSLLTYNGVEDVLAEDMVRGLTAGEKSRALRGELAEQLLARITIRQPLACRRGKRIAAFFGPTGVGKTTTIAKVAADAAIRYGRKVGLVTLDTYRIAAVEQLAAYADIMEIPLKVASDRPALERSLRELKGCDLVLIDTAGRNPKDEDAIRQVTDLMTDAGVVDRLLCVAAGTSPRTLAEVIRAFEPTGFEELVITKMDECVGHGSMLNAHLRTGRPLTYYTTGQRVPEDIEPASAERLIRLVLEQWAA